MVERAESGGRRAEGREQRAEGRGQRAFLSKPLDLIDLSTS